MLDAKNLIKKILLAFEQSSTTIKYSKIYEYNDGPNKIKQITLSFGLTEYGNLKKLVRTYCLKGGMFADQLTPFINQISVNSLCKSVEFKKLLTLAGEDPIMQQCQEEAYDSMYIDPAYKFCSTNNIVTNLGKLVICDSYLHSGSILSLLRNKFAEAIPSKGGDEKKWIESYCTVRREWLKNHSNTDLHNTVYRMNFMLDIIKKGDWDLSQSPFTANGVKING